MLRQYALPIIAVILLGLAAVLAAQDLISESLSPGLGSLLGLLVGWRLTSSSSQKKNNKVNAICLHCGQSNPNLQCARCHMAAYCNVECQRSHWTQHKKECFSKKEREAKAMRQREEIVQQALAWGDALRLNKNKSEQKQESSDDDGQSTSS